MPPVGRYSMAILVGLIASVIFLAVALGTRYWIYEYVRPQGDPYGLLSLVCIGLFKTSVDGIVYDTAHLLPEFKDKFNTTIILEGVGGCLLLVTATFYIVFLLRKRHIILIAAFVSCALVSGALLIAGAVFFSTNVSPNDNHGYSWYLALFSGIIELACIFDLGIAIGKGELGEIEKSLSLLSTT